MPAVEKINVIINGQAWKEVDTFTHHGPDDQIYRLDSSSGIVTFGDGSHGQRPPVGATIAARLKNGRDEISFIWTSSDLPETIIVTTFPDSFRINRCRGSQQCWRWKLAIWLCKILTAC